MPITLTVLAHPVDRWRLRRAVRGRGRAHPDFAAMRDAVAQELAPFAARGIDAAAVDRQWAALEGWDAEHAARLVARGGRVRARARRADHERVRWMSWAIERLARWFALPDLDLLLYFGDHIDRDPEHAPVLCFCRRRQRVGQVLIPDFEMLRGHERLDRSVDRAARGLAWEARAPRAFWRGVTTGGRFDQPGWEAIPRARLVTLAHARPDLIDARFTRLVQGADANPTLAAPEWRSAEVSPADSVRYRYLIDVDGN
ncbi:MAG TPA: glycosyl transferase family 90, partial [Gemmatimonadales bacterium]|nr:glycosyl transferase family 90 [Gemmatimonadales bacterium]